MSIMVRTARDSFVALQTADAMEAAGAPVVALTTYKSRESITSFPGTLSYMVWARVRDDAHIRLVDIAIEKEMGGFD